MSAGTTGEAGRLRWLLRRGMKELDVILERYYQRNYAAASAAEREAFVALLQQEDPAIWAWTMGYEVAPAPFADVIQQLRRYA